MKLIEGRRVRLSIDGKVGTATLYLREDNYWCIKDCSDGLKICGGWWVENPKGERYSTVDWIEPLNSTDIRDVYVGAKIRHPNGNQREVLAMSGRLIWPSISNDFDAAIGGGCTLEELIRYGFTLVPEEPEEEMVTVTISKKSYESLKKELK